MASLWPAPIFQRGGASRGTTLQQSCKPLAVLIFSARHLSLLDCVLDGSSNIFQSDFAKICKIQGLINVILRQLHGGK